MRACFGWSAMSLDGLRQWPDTPGEPWAPTAGEPWSPAGVDTEAEDQPAPEVVVHLVSGDPRHRRAIEDALIGVSPGGLGMHRLNCVDTLAAGIDLLRAHRPDVVLLAAGLPDTVGLNGLRKLLDEDRSLAVIFLVDQEETALGREALEHGAQDFLLGTGFTAEQLRRSIGYAMMRASAAAVTTSVEERFRSVVQGISDVVSIHDADGGVTYIAPSAAQGLGHTRVNPLLGSGFLDHVHPEDRARLRAAFMKWKLGSRETVQYRLRTTGGHYVHCESVGVNLLADPSVAGMVVTTRDVTERRQGEDRLVYQATHNPLTGLPNRVLLMHRLQGLVNDPEDAERPVALALMNIDHLKLINSNHGHRAGDELIVAVAERLKLSQDGDAAVFHLGGDEFAIIYDQVPEPRHALARAREVARCFDEPFIVQSHARRVRCSMGVAHVTAGDLPVTTRSTTSGAEELLSRAETALWKAKAGGGDRIQLFDDELRRITLQRLRIEEDLEQAIDNDQLVLYYQPVVEIATGRLVGFEALLRWNHPVEGLLAPDAFMETAERTNLILPIGIWVLRTACLELAALHAEHPELGLTMAVNLSMRQLNDPDLFDALDRALAASGVPPANLCLEVSESTVMEDVAAAQHTLGALHGRGVRIAIDDFGTGYSSLAYLKRFPIEVLKVDRTFVAGLITDPEDTVIVDLVIHLAERMGLDVIAEGVETEAHRQELVRMGCRFGQGYLWSRPVPPGQLGAMVDGVWGSPTGAGGPPGGANVPGDVDGTDGSDRPDGADGPAGGDGVPSATVDEARFADTVATLAHELRNPIHAVRSAVTLLQMELDELREAGGEASDALWHQAGAELETIVRQTGGMEAIVSSMADLQAIGAGNLPLQTAVWLLDDLVGRVVRDMVRQDAPPVVVGDLPSVRILADPVRIGQILGNVIGNAFRFSPPGAPVLVWGELAEGWVAVHVVDQGPGIPPDQVGRLFRKFARADHTSRGIGIGLYLARGLARCHGGDLRYRRADTGGSDFVLTLPLPEDRFEI